MKSRLTDLIPLDGRDRQIYCGQLEAKFLHSHSQLHHAQFRFAGEISLYDIPEDAVLATIDTFAYRVRHQETGAIKRLRTGTFPDGLTGKQRPLKLCAVLKDKDLFVIVVKANKNVQDLAPMAPMRISGMSELYNAVRRARNRFSSANKSNQPAHQEVATQPEF